jgi:hypothetical protein
MRIHWDGMLEGANTVTGVTKVATVPTAMGIAAQKARDSLNLEQFNIDSSGTAPTPTGKGRNR